MEDSLIRHVTDARKEPFHATSLGLLTQSLSEDEAWKGFRSLNEGSNAIQIEEQRANCVMKCYRWTKSNWIWEILATIGSLLCEGAIVVILVSMQNKPLSRWTSSVSINAFVATLTTATKSLVLYSAAGCVGQLKWIYFRLRSRQLYQFELFDRLSRGPLGAIQSCFRIRWGAAYLAMLVTLLTLAIDPFAQQVVRFDQQDVPEADTSVSYGINHNYTSPASAVHSNAVVSMIGIDTQSENSSMLKLPRSRQGYASRNLEWSIQRRNATKFHLHIEMHLGRSSSLPRIH